MDVSRRALVLALSLTLAALSVAAAPPATAVTGDGGVLAFAHAQPTVTENQASVFLQVNRTGTTAGTVAVDFETRDGTATAGVDYQATSGTLTFAPGQSGVWITIPLIDDAVFDGNKAFVVRLTDPTNDAVLGPQSRVAVFVYDNEDLPGSLEFQYPLLSPVTEGGGQWLPVRRYGGTGGTVTVAYQTIDGTATAGDDYTPASGVLTFGPTQNTQHIFVATLDDGDVEGDHAFSVVLSSPTGGADLGDQVTATVQIADNDHDAGTFEFWPPSSFGSVAVAETTPSVTLTVRRYGPTRGAASVDYTAVPVTAGEGTDFLAAAGTISFGANQTTKTLSIPLVDDGDLEGSEVFNVVLSNPSAGGFLGPQSSITVEIVDNETAAREVYVEAAHRAVAVAEDGVARSITVRRDGTAAVSVDYGVVGATATPGVDVTVAAGTLTWAAGDTSPKTIPYTPVADPHVEGNEVFQIVLANPVGAVLDENRTATISITDNDSPPGYIQMATVPGFGEAGGPVSVIVDRVNGSGGTVSVDYQIVDITATASADLSGPASGVLTWGPGDTSTKYIVVGPVNDTLVEGEETFMIVLSDPTGGARLSTSRSALGRIADDESPPGYIGWNGGGMGLSETSAPTNFFLSRIDGAGGAISVRYDVIDLTSTRGADYHTPAASGTISWADKDGASKNGTPFTPINDSAVEGLEMLLVVLSEPTGGAQIGRGGVWVVWLGDDEVNLPGQVGLAAPEVQAPEDSGVLEFVVRRTAGAAGQVTASYAVTAGTATAGEDFTPVSGTLRWYPGDTSDRVISVPVVADAVTEPDETITLTLSAVAGASAGTTTATGTIVNDDFDGTLRVIADVVNDSGGSAGAGDFMVDTGTGAAFPAASPPGVDTALAAGTTFDVIATGPSGYTASYGSECSGVMAAGALAVCTVTLDDQPGTLTVVTEVVNDEGGTATPADFTVNTGTGVAIAGAAAPGVDVLLDAGTVYAVTATGPSGYATTYGAACNGVMGLGEAVTCVVTHDDQVAAPPPAEFVFGGFVPPLRPWPEATSIRAGSALPVKWRLNSADGSPVADPASFDSLHLLPGACATPVVATPVELYGGGPDVTYEVGDGSAPHWQYTLKTGRDWSGCGILELRLADGTAHQAAVAFP